MNSAKKASFDDTLAYYDTEQPWTCTPCSQGEGSGMRQTTHTDVDANHELHLRRAVMPVDRKAS